jgi:hypothetical protein
MAGDVGCGLDLRRRRRIRLSAHALMDQGAVFGIAILVVAVVVTLVWVAHRIEQRRLAALRAWAEAFGWTFKPDRQEALERIWPGIRHFEQGHSRYGCNWVEGRHRDRRFRLCEYHFAITSSNGKTTTTQHHWSTVAIIDSDLRLSPLRIRSETFFDKIAALVGWHDIDTESDAFNRRFHVSAVDRRWACDALPPATIEALLGTQNQSLECAVDAVVVVASRRLGLEDLERPLAMGIDFLDNLPGFLRGR